MSEIEIDHMKMRDLFTKRVAGDICNNNVLLEDWRIIVSNLGFILEEREKYIKQWELPRDSTLIAGAE